MSTESIKEELRSRQPQLTVNPREMLSTGSTVLNLACSGSPLGAFPKGSYIHIVGDSDTGKSFIAMSCLAEAARSKAFKDYRLIQDVPEGNTMLDIEAFFGTKLSERLEPPAGTREEPEYSFTVQDFYYHVDDAFKVGKPFIYALDSMSILDTEQDQDKFDKQKKAAKKGRLDESGSYGVDKAKENSKKLRVVRSRLRETGSILIIVSQTRDKIGMNVMPGQKTYAGGMALKFYALMEIWLSPRQDIKQRILGKDRSLGVVSRYKFSKNHLTGRRVAVDVPIFHSFGVDDIGGCVDYLVEEGHWSKEGEAFSILAGKITAKEFDFKGNREQLVKHIEDNSLEKDLRALVTEVWQSIRDRSAIQRKPRYI